VNIHKEPELNPSPERVVGTWGTIGRRHAATLRASDFRAERTGTLGGLVDLYMLLFMYVGMRWAFGTGPRPTAWSSWVA
jgi:hypothetical protein